MSPSTILTTRMHKVVKLAFPNPEVPSLKTKVPRNVSFRTLNCSQSGTSSANKIKYGKAFFTSVFLEDITFVTRSLEIPPRTGPDYETAHMDKDCSALKYLPCNHI